MVRQPHTTTTSTAAATAATTTSLLLTPPKRKKGRPSLHDLQQRKLFQQQQQQQQQLINNNDHRRNPNSRIGIDDRQHQNPNSSNSLPRRRRRTSNLSAKFLLDSDTDSDTDLPNSDSDDERASKKVRRLSSNKNPQINDDISQEEKGSKATVTHNETRMLAGPTNASTSASASATVLPDKKLLLLLLDKLQKKDTRGVFAEPVDPEELPDYHEVIENPMDFGTVRSNLINGGYKTLEQFEEDVYLISSNAMQYNPPSTVFFRQARSIQELAKKEFETLRHDAGLSEPPSKPRRGRPPGSRNLKKLLESSPVDHGASDSPSDATPMPTPAPAPTPIPAPSSREDDATKSGSYNLRKGPSLYRFPRKLENCFDLSASSSRYTSTRYGKKPCGSEENRRDTYFSSQCDSDQDSLAAFGGSERQLIAVDLASNHSYARSLARFAGDLGPVVWSIASKKLRSVLPPSVNFGPGWVDEVPLPEKSVQSSSLLQDSYNNKHHSLRPDFTSSSFAPKHSASCSESFTGAGESTYSRERSSLNGINGGIAPSSIIHPPMNNFGSGSNSQFQEGFVRPASSSFFNDGTSASAALNNLQSPPLDYHGIMNPETTPYWKSLSMQEKWDQLYPSELSGGFQASSSRNSNLPIGSPPQLDLVLQL
ncbi:hypothetical protein RND81_02G060100 [Saponaria officinalis]|uniref:Bromo domain-containing protein n=1 Tax=Saponaria officinalis TaxID=3572 RepID=A0AAW1MSA7_SAPOF